MYTVAASPIRLKHGEVEKVCKSLKNKKAPGPGNIPAELIKHGTDKLYEEMRTIFEKYLNGEEIPDEWNTSIITTIHKKGSRERCENYRGIAVTSSMSRIYGKILKNRIEEQYTDMEAEEQAGFRAGRSTVDHLFSLTQIIEKKVAYNQEVHLLYIDLKKAYDSVPQEKLWEALEKTNIDANTITAVKNMYTKCEAKVKVGRTLTKAFKVTKGLKQGCCVAPTLFKIYLEQALKTWKRKCRLMGIPLSDEYTIYTLCFADDQVLLAQEYDDLQYMTRKLTEEYKKWGLDINMKKTEYMCIGGTQQDLALEDGTTIKRCDKYKYLGLQITKDGTLEEAILEKNIQGRRAIKQLNSILWDKKISKDNKRRIYNTIVKSIATYSSEVWQLKKKNEKTLIATEMDFWRRSAGKSRLDKVSNDKIRKIMKVPSTIVDDIKTKQLIWYGHVQRMEEERIPKQIIKWRPYGKKKRGRPRRSWREGVDKEVQERELPKNLWTNRKEWKLGVERRRRTL